MLVGVPLLALGYCSFIAFRVFNPTYGLTDIDLVLLSHCARSHRDDDCNLIPTYFKSGELRDEIAARMLKAGYVHHVLAAGGETWQIDKATEIVTDYFSGPVVSPTLGCSSDLGIIMRFDPWGRLQRAEGDNSTACL